MAATALFATHPHPNAPTNATRVVVDVGAPVGMSVAVQVAPSVVVRQGATLVLPAEYSNKNMVISWGFHRNLTINNRDLMGFSWDI